jgi:hypothetical protein
MGSKSPEVRSQKLEFFQNSEFSSNIVAPIRNREDAIHTFFLEIGGKTAVSY